MLWEDMASAGCTSMPTGTINQDFVENFSSQVRYRNGHAHVTPREFRNVFKFLLVHHIMDPSRGKNTNCLNDDARFLQIFKSEEWKQLKTLVPPESAAPALLRTAESGEASRMEIECIDGIENYDPKKNPGDTKYSSYLARRIILSSSSKCQMCIDAFSVTESNRDLQHEVITLIENPLSDYRMIAAQQELQILVHKAVVRFVATLRKSYASKNLGHELSGTIESTQGFNLLQSCSLHSDTNPRTFIKVMKTSLLRLLMRDENNLLKKRLKDCTNKAKVGSLAASSKEPIKLFYGDVFAEPSNSTNTAVNSRSGAEVYAHLPEKYAKAASELRIALLNKDQPKQMGSQRSLFGPKPQAVPSAIDEVILGAENLDESWENNLLDVSGMSGIFHSTPTSTPKRLRASTPLIEHVPKKRKCNQTNAACQQLPPLGAGKNPLTCHSTPPRANPSSWPNEALRVTSCSPLHLVSWAHGQRSPSPVSMQAARPRIVTPLSLALMPPRLLSPSPVLISNPGGKNNAAGMLPPPRQPQTRTILGRGQKAGPLISSPLRPIAPYPPNQLTYFTMPGVAPCQQSKSNVPKIVIVIPKL